MTSEPGTPSEAGAPPPRAPTMMARIIRFSLERKLVVYLLALVLVGWGIYVAPFDWELPGIHRDPVPVDAIPDIGENQQIVFTDWMGRSPKDVEDQITYPLTTRLMGVPGVKTIRSFSMFGFSTIYLIFKEDVEFYWSRSRVLEKLASLPAGYLPDGVRPGLGPDATGLGQIYWYTLEGRDQHGRPAPGWSLQELRRIQDYTVRYALQSVEGVAEVASIGGHVKEYQVDVDPDALRVNRVTLEQVIDALRQANRDVGARTIEINRVDYLVRGLGTVKSVADLEQTVIRTERNVPIRVKDVARVQVGPEFREGALDKEGAEATGGVVVARFGSNPLQVIKDIKKKIAEITPGLPRKTLAGGRVSHVTVVPFYDRSGLIYETLETLNAAITEEILITILVIVVMAMQIRSALLISSLLPIAVLMTFIAMKLFHVDANIVALSGIAIAIGTIVDMGIVIMDNINRHLEQAPPEEDRLEVVFRATSEVGSAVLTAVATTVVSFLPVFAMEAAEGKLFKPLAYTKTFALVASVVVAIFLIPPIAHTIYTSKIVLATVRRAVWVAVAALAAVIGLRWSLPWLAGFIVGFSAWQLGKEWLPDRVRFWASRGASVAVALLVVFLLARHWLPLGPEKGLVRNLAFVAGIFLVLQAQYWLFARYYRRILGWCLDHKVAFLAIPTVITVTGLMVWLGFDRMLGWLPSSVKRTRPVAALARAFPGLGKEFMPSLDEGAFLYMPTTMPHASLGEVMDSLRKQDMAIRALPEVDGVVGKLGRVGSAIDPAPISMIETVISYRSEYLLDRRGRHLTFRFDSSGTDLVRDSQGLPLPAPDGKPYRARGRFHRDGKGRLVPDPNGQPFRQWRSALDSALNPGRKAWAGVRKPDDIWRSIVEAAEVPGVTSAPRLQPIAARIVMLQSGMRAAMGVKVRGPDLATVETVAIRIEQLLKQVPSIEPTSVVADRSVGTAYLEIHLDREAAARYGVTIETAQTVIEFALGGETVTRTIEGRERYGVRVRYLRERRDSIEAIGEILVPVTSGGMAGGMTDAATAAGSGMGRGGGAGDGGAGTGGGGMSGGAARGRSGAVVTQAPVPSAAPAPAPQIPLRQIARIDFVRGPQMIRSEDTFTTTYVLFDKKGDVPEVTAVNQADAFLKTKVKSGELVLPDEVSYAFAGSYEAQVRSERKLMIILPLALVAIFLLIYFQFRSVPVTMLVFSGIAVAWAGGFLLLWCYAQPWFLDFRVFGTSMRELFQVHPIHLSVAVWVGFLALFGIATDDGVVMATFLDQRFGAERVSSIADIRRLTIDAGERRVRACLMTTATTVLALLPVITSSGRGSDIMVPMALPSFGGMIIEVMTMLIVPVLYAALVELRFRQRARHNTT